MRFTSMLTHGSSSRDQLCRENGRDSRRLVLLALFEARTAYQPAVIIDESDDTMAEGKGSSTVINLTDIRAKSMAGELLFDLVEELNIAIKSATTDRLRETLQTIIQRSEFIAKHVSSLLLVPEDQIRVREDVEESSSEESATGVAEWEEENGVENAVDHNQGADATRDTAEVPTEPIDSKSRQLFLKHDTMSIGRILTPGTGNEKKQPDSSEKEARGEITQVANAHAKRPEADWLGARPKGNRLAREPVNKRMRSRYAMCVQCNEEFDLTDNRKGDCEWHEGARSI